MVKFIEIDFNRTYRSKHDGEYRILADLGSASGVHLISVEFLQKNMFGFNTERTVEAKHILTGNVVDCYQPHVLGVACKGNAATEIDGHPFAEYVLWKSIINKCYGKIDRNIIFTPQHQQLQQQYGYMVIPNTRPVVCLKWLCYEYFLQDIQYIDGYYMWKSDVEDYELSLAQNYLATNQQHEFNVQTTVFTPKYANYLSVSS